MAKYRKKPVVIEAIQWHGYMSNEAEIRAFVGDALYDPYDTKPILVIKTLEGDMTAQQGDWIIKGVKGEFYPCKPDVFATTYESADGVSRDPAAAYEIPCVMEDRKCQPSDEPGAWTCNVCGFRGFWSGGPHCTPGVMACDAPQPHGWEWRFYDTAHGPAGWGAWKPLEPHTRLQTIEDAVTEMRDYIQRGYRYQLRQTFAGPAEGYSPGATHGVAVDRHQTFCEKTPAPSGVPIEGKRNG